MTRIPGNLTAIRSELADRWSIEIFAPFSPGGQCSWVAPARRSSGEDVVLKIGWPHPEAEHEADGLTLWAGRGTIRLLESATFDHTPVMLLERCVPGTHLARLRPPAERDTVVAGLLRRLWCPPPFGHVFRPLHQMCTMWADDADRRLQTATVTDAGLIRAGLELFRRLPADSGRAVVLFTDLHAENILAAQREPWLAIDPKPYLGDPTYDVLQHMLNVPRLRADPDGLTLRMAELLDLDSERLRLWLFARCCIEALDDPSLAEVARLVRP